MFYWLGLREYMAAYKITQGLVILFTLKKALLFSTSSCYIL